MFDGNIRTIDLYTDAAFMFIHGENKASLLKTLL